jgi:hypothetical protein
MGSGVKADSMPLAVVMFYLLVIIMRKSRSSRMLWASYKSGQCMCSSKYSYICVAKQPEALHMLSANLNDVPIPIGQRRRGMVDYVFLGRLCHEPSLFLFLEIMIAISSYFQTSFMPSSYTSR